MLRPVRLSRPLPDNIFQTPHPDIPMGADAEWQQNQNLAQERIDAAVAAPAPRRRQPTFGGEDLIYALMALLSGGRGGASAGDYVYGKFRRAEQESARDREAYNRWQQEEVEGAYGQADAADKEWNRTMVNYEKARSGVPKYEKLRQAWDRLREPPSASTSASKPPALPKADAGWITRGTMAAHDLDQRLNQKGDDTPAEFLQEQRSYLRLGLESIDKQIRVLHSGLATATKRKRERGEETVEGRSAALQEAQFRTAIVELAARRKPLYEASVRAQAALGQVAAVAQARQKA
ncbi:hypothetical protein EON81_05695 [bacterium]|nr:MAG: hypothetical protein EON81_05695 [bacterium]